VALVSTVSVGPKDPNADALAWRTT
jgi:hypothetical protein